MKQFIAAATFAMFLATPAMAEPPMLLGFGAEPGGCGVWATEASGTWIDLIYAAWVMDT
jgi:hypothetical protein